MTSLRMQRNGFALILLALLAAPAFAASLAAAPEERVEANDTDKDGKPDEWRIYQGEYLIRLERDRDKDGKAEVWVYYETVQPTEPVGAKPVTRAVRAEVDRNGDGKPDLLRLMKDGKPDRERADLNLDGKPDAWSYYKDGNKELMMMDKNHDGKPDAWFYYALGGTKLVGGKVDENFDGKPDRVFGKFPEEETRQPW